MADSADAGPHLTRETDHPYNPRPSVDCQRGPDIGYYDFFAADKRFESVLQFVCLIKDIAVDNSKPGLRAVPVPTPQQAG